MYCVSYGLSLLFLATLRISFAVEIKDGKTRSKAMECMASILYWGGRNTSKSTSIIQAEKQLVAHTIDVSSVHILKLS